MAARSTAADEIVPAPQNGMRYAAGVPGADDGVVGAPTSGHYGFVLPGHADRSEDRTARADVVEASTRFFRRTWGAPVPEGG